MATEGPFTAEDLSRYRVVFAVVMLALLPPFHWASALPSTLAAPPPGVAALVGGIPGAGVLIGLEVALALALSALLVGFRVGLASVAATVLILVGYGASYSFGKIDHNILVVLAPVVLWAAGWSGLGEPRPWVMRLLAWIIGLGFLTAGLPKLLTGWLDPSTHATQGWFVRSYYSQDRTGWLASWLAEVDSPWFWEPMDWSAVVLELSVVVLALCSWRAWRVGLALLVLFHAGVLLMLNITFATHVLVYAAFVPWGRLVRWPGSLPVGALVPVAIGGWGVSRLIGDPLHAVGPVVVLAGAAVATAFLLRRLRPQEPGAASTRGLATLEASVALTAPTRDGRHRLLAGSRRPRR